jgi:hypothetical protein
MSKELYRNNYEELTNKERHFGVVLVEQVKEIRCVNVWTIIKRESYDARFGAVVYSCAIWNTPELRSCNAGC